MTETYDLQTYYHIIDNYGTYYCLNGNNELVSAHGIGEAGIFSYSEASAKIGDGKRSRFYKVVPVNGERCLCSESPTVKEMSPESRLFQDIADLAEVNWIELLSNLVYINAMLPSYKEKLTEDQSRTELLIIDLMHYIELYKYDDQKALEVMDRLREAREKRRIIKNELFRLDVSETPSAPMRTQQKRKKLSSRSGEEKTAITDRGWMQDCSTTRNRSSAGFIIVTRIVTAWCTTRNRP